MLDDVEKILDTVNPSIVEFADMRVYRSNDLNLTVRKGNVESAVSDKLEGIAIRTLVNGVWGFASVASLEPTDIRNGLAAATKMAKGASSSIKRKISIQKDQTFEARNEFNPDLDPKDLSFEEKLDIAKKIDKTLMNHDQRITNSIGRYSEKLQREEIINSLGTRVVNDYGVFRASGMATARSGDIIQNVSDSLASNSGMKRITNWDIDEAMTNLGSRAVELLDAKPSPSGRMNVLLEQSLVGVYIHEAFGHASEGDAILANRSVLKDQIGNKMAVEGINVVDDPTLSGMRGSFKYDSEGTPTQKRQIVEKGILKSYLNDLATSDMLDTGNVLNGSGRATDFRHTPMPRMGNTYIGEGNMSFDELVSEIGDGVYLKHSYGGYVMPASGQFYFSSQSGYLIENGEITAPIRNSGMSGMTLDVLQNTIGIGDDLIIDAFPGVCGKGGLTGFQPMPVTGGGPHVAAKDIVVGGR